MAKTRMKTTPTRMQKDALMAATATTVTVAMAGVDDVRKRLRQSNTPKQQLRATSTIIVTAPKRTNSISSAASSMSHASDTCHSAHSDTDSPPPQLQTAARPAITALTAAPSATASAPRTLNSLLSTTSDAHMSTLKNRKVYMITERCEESCTESASSSNAAGQKRKMYLIMEENSTESNDGTSGAIADAQKYLKNENGLVVTAPKKLTLFADKSDVVLSQNFEKILPEILNRIQAKDTSNSTNNNIVNNTHTTPSPPPPTTNTAPVATVPIKLHNGAVGMNIATAVAAIDSNNTSVLRSRQDEIMDHNKRLPITLPPKKNRTKIITTHTSNNNNNINCNISNYDNSNNSNNVANSNNVVIKNSTNCTLPAVQIKQISAATPVIVSTASLPPMHNNTAVNSNRNSSSHNNKYTHNGQTSMALATSAQSAPQKNINLSTDFLFLMKMLPMLESIPEPQKNNVKNYIEKIITQNANLFAKQ